MAGLGEPFQGAARLPPERFLALDGRIWILVIRKTSITSIVSSGWTTDAKRPPGKTCMKSGWGTSAYRPLGMWTRNAWKGTASRCRRNWSEVISAGCVDLLLAQPAKTEDGRWGGKVENRKQKAEQKAEMGCCSLVRRLLTVQIAGACGRGRAPYGPVLTLARATCLGVDLRFSPLRVSLRSFAVICGELSVIGGAIESSEPV